MLGQAEDQPKPSWSRCLWFFVKGSAYFIGSLLFLCGSVLYLPHFYALEGIPGGGPMISGWMFEIGCVCFVIGTFQDMWELRESATRAEQHRLLDPRISTTIELRQSYDLRSSLYSLSIKPSAPSKSCLHRSVPLLNATVYFVASVIFLIGGTFFLPYRPLYEAHPSLGAIAFIIGCVLYAAGALWDVIRLGWMRRDGSTSPSWCWQNTLRTQTVVAFCSFVGAWCFIVGSYYFLPEFLIDDASVVYSVTHFIVGSVWFAIGAAVSLFILHRSFIQFDVDDSSINTKMLFP